MTLNIKREVAALRRMTPRELRQKYLEVTGETTRSGNRQALVKQLAWLIQARAEGGLSERARRRAEQLARDSDIRLTPPKENGTTRPRTAPLPTRDADDRLPPPGSVISRSYKGRRIEVAVLDDGFEHEGETFKSLSAVAKEVTGSHLNGFAFFRLTRERRDV